MTIAGVVTQVRARHEGATFDSDVFAIADGTLPAQVQEAAEITTTRVEPEIYVPPAPGASVRRASGEERDGALYFDRMERRIPIGHAGATASRCTSTPSSSTAPAARTSRSPASPAWPPRPASPPGCSTRCSAPACWAGPARPPTPARSSSTSRARTCSSWTTRTPGSTPTPAPRTPGSGLDAGPFPDVCVYAPPRAGDRTGAPDVASRLTGVDSFYWTLAEFCADRLLPYVFADADDDRQQYTMVVHSVAAYLQRHAEPADGGVVIDGAPRQLVPGPGRPHRRAALRRGHPRRVGRARAVGLGTVNAFLRRLISSTRDLARLIRGDLPTQPAARHQHRRERPGDRGRPAQPARPRRSASWSA